MAKTSFMKVDRLVRVLSGGAVVTDRLVEKREEKIEDAVADLAQEIKRLEQAKIDSPYLKDQYQQLLARQNMVSRIAKNADRSKELDLIKADARKAASLGPVLVDGRLASNEIFRTSLLMHAQLDRLQDRQIDDAEAKRLRVLVGTLDHQYDQATDMRDIKKRTEALQKVRSEFRKESAGFSLQVDNLVQASHEFNELWKKSVEAYGRARSAVESMERGEGRDSLQARLTKCIERIRFVALKKYDNSNCFSEFDPLIKEADRIAALAQQDLRSGKSKADTILKKVSDAKRLAETNPSGPEAKMMSALAGQNSDVTPEQNARVGVENFEKFLKAAYEQAAVSGVNVNMLSPGDVVALHNYTTPDYSGMNRALFQDYKNDNTGEYKKKNDATIQALKKLPSYEGGMTMRGEWLWPDNAHEKVYYLGSTFSIKAFWSTGVKMCFDYTPIQISVFGKSGKDIAGVSDKPNETEVLFPPGTTFKVTAYREEGEKRDLKIFVTVEEV